LNLSDLFISHDLSTIQAVCDEIVVMYQGEKVEQIASRAVLSGAAHPYSRTLFASAPKMDTFWLDGRNLPTDWTASRIGSQKTPVTP